VRVKNRLGLYLICGSEKPIGKGVKDGTVSKGCPGFDTSSTYEDDLLVHEESEGKAKFLPGELV